MLFSESYFAPNPWLTSTALAKDKVVRAEKLTKWTSADCIHGTGFEINEDSTWNIFVSGCLRQQLVLSFVGVFFRVIPR